MSPINPPLLAESLQPQRVHLTLMARRFVVRDRPYYSRTPVSRELPLAHACEVTMQVEHGPDPSHSIGELRDDFPARRRASERGTQAGRRRWHTFSSPRRWGQLLSNQGGSQHLRRRGATQVLPPSPAPRGGVWGRP